MAMSYLNHFDVCLIHQVKCCDVVLGLYLTPINNADMACYITHSWCGGPGTDLNDL